MTRRMSAKEARENFSDLLGMVCYGKEPVIIERKGKPMVVVISPEQWERYEQQVMQRFRETVAEFQRLNQDIDPDEGLREITAIVEEVRGEQHERQQPGR